MSSMSLRGEYGALPAGPLTVADLEGFPDDGHRYELIDGVLVVTPAPGRLHQRAVLRLARVLEDAAPPSCEVIVAPFAVRPDSPEPLSAQRSELQPDVLVGLETQFTDRDLLGAPLLAVEVVSTSTQLFDRNLKKAAYERMGVAHFWLLDPAAAELHAYELDAEGVYQLVGHASGEELFRAEHPFPVELRPAELLHRPSSP